MRPPRRAPSAFAAVAASALLAALTVAAPPADAGRPADGDRHGASTTSRTLAAGESGTGVPAPRSVAASARGTLRPAGRSSIRFTDVSRGYWARSAIDYVAGAHRWMRDYPAGGRGRVEFRPDKLESRKRFLRAAVQAFAPDAHVDRGIRFSDLDSTAPFYRYADIAVDRGWIDRGAGHAIHPDSPVTMATVHRVLVLALGLKRAAAGLNRIHTADGRRFDTWTNFGTTVIGMRIGLRYNHDNESLDVNPSSPMPRSEVAWSLYRATTAATYTLDAMNAYDDITLPRMSDAERRVVEWGIRFAGYPYVWGGEWYRPTGGGYCCGAQPVGGFDCSGLTWWLMKTTEGTWDPRPPRPYAGWSLPQRTSTDMARAGRSISWAKTQVGDLLLYDGTGDGVVDHVDTYVGNGWALDSSSGVGGVTFMWVGSGWYRDHFKHARRIA
jgi:cell wall-associated NlpC family hydrolase